MKPPTAIVRGQHAGRKPERDREQDGDAGVQALEVHHGPRDVDDCTQRASLVTFLLLVLGPGAPGLQGVQQHEAADDPEDHDERDADVEVRPAAPYGRLDPLLDGRAVEHAGFGRHAEHEAEFKSTWPVLGALEAPDERLRELVAHVAGDRHEPGDAEAHHAGGQHEGAAGADEAADEAAEKPTRKR